MKDPPSILIKSSSNSDKKIFLLNFNGFTILAQINTFFYFFFIMGLQIYIMTVKQSRE